ncbi:MAG: hypothetical protein JOY71_19450 [Acetobacteraceae bacterium]|nr:hypothetical protein [Acetobacteraceae bacterium]MBV8591187.1 hypothetical protein [Acetobacteraceae bacterium]
MPIPSLGEDHIPGLEVCPDGLDGLEHASSRVDQRRTREPGADGTGAVFLEADFSPTMTTRDEILANGSPISG